MSGILIRYKFGTYQKQAKNSPQSKENPRAQQTPNLGSNNIKKQGVNDTKSTNNNKR